MVNTISQNISFTYVFRQMSLAVSPQRESENASNASVSLREIASEIGARRSLAIVQTFAPDGEWTSFDDDSWRVREFEKAFARKGIKTIRLEAFTEDFAYWGYSLIVPDFSSEMFAQLEISNQCPVFVKYGLRNNSWSTEHGTVVTVCLSEVSDNPHMSPVALSSKTYQRQTLDPAITLPSESLASKRKFMSLVGRRISSIEFAVENKVSTKWVADLTWKTAFAKYPSYIPWYMEISCGGGPSIPDRASGGFVNEGFTPLSYFALCHSLNSEQLLAHSGNIFNHGRKRAGGGKNGSEQIIRGSEFRAFPKLLEFGLTPIEAARAILDHEGIQDDLVTAFGTSATAKTKWEATLCGQTQITISELETRLDELSKGIEK